MTPTKLGQIGFVSDAQKGRMPGLVFHAVDEVAKLGPLSDEDVLMMQDKVSVELGEAGSDFEFDSVVKAAQRAKSFGLNFVSDAIGAFGVAEFVCACVCDRDIKRFDSDNQGFGIFEGF